MKKTFIFIISLVFISAMVTSCLKVDDPICTTDIFYIAETDSITFSAKEDAVWKKDIISAIAKLNVTHTPIEVKDTVPSSQQYASIGNCNYKADKIYDKKQKGLTLSDIKKAIYNAHADSLVKLGYKDGSEALPIRKFTHHSSLINTLNNKVISSYSFDVE